MPPLHSFILIILILTEKIPKKRARESQISVQGKNKLKKSVGIKNIQRNDR